MADEPENLTIRLPQEMRESMSRLEVRLDEGLRDLTQRVDGNTLPSNLVAGVTHDQEQRIAALKHGKA